MGFFSRVKNWFISFFGVEEEEGGLDYEGEEVFADFSVRKLQKYGKSSVGVTIPKEWLEAHNIDIDENNKVMVLADSNIVIVNPNEKDKVLKELEDVVNRVGVEELKKAIRDKAEEVEED